MYVRSPRDGRVCGSGRWPVIYERERRSAPSGCCAPVRTAVYMKEWAPAACTNEVHDYVGTAESAAGVACDLRVTGGYGSSGGLVRGRVMRFKVHMSS